MKKIIFVFAIGLLLIACDPGSDCSFYVRNNCSDTICMIITRECTYVGPLKTTTIHISPSENRLIHKETVFDTPPELYFIGYFFSTFVVTKGKDTSKRDYMLPLFWELTTHQRGKNFDAFFNLAINPEDFE